MTIAWLHIGTEKTGSTSIQKYLLENRVALARAGFLYPESAGILSNFKLIAFAKLDDGEAVLPVMNRRHGSESERASWEQAFRRDHRQELEKFAATDETESGGGSVDPGTCRKVVMYSSEHFHSRVRKYSEIEKTVGFLREFHEEVRVICYLRRQDKLAVSAYSTMLRAGHDAAFSVRASEGRSRYFDYLDLLEQWDRAVGRKNLYVRHFARDSLTGGDVVEDFCSLVGIDFNNPGYARPVNQNESLSRTASHLLRVFNRTLKARGFPERQKRSLRRRFVDSLENLTDDFPQEIPDRDWAQTFYGNYRADNENVSEHWMNGKPFSEDFSEYSTLKPEEVEIPDQSKFVMDFFLNELYPDQNN